jgi:hypothetical protein
VFSNNVAGTVVANVQWHCIHVRSMLAAFPFLSSIGPYTTAQLLAALLTSELFAQHRMSARALNETLVFVDVRQFRV